MSLKDYRMRRWTVQFIGAIVGIATFFILPGVFKFFGFIFAIFAFAISLRSVNNYFNMNILVISLCIFAMFGTSFFTFDASNPFNYKVFVSYAQVGATTIMMMGGIGVPILLVIGGIWGIIRGNALGGTQSIFYAFVSGGAMVSVCFVLETFNVPTFGTARFVLNFWMELISWAFDLPIQIYEMTDQIATDLGMGDIIDLPDIPESKYFREPKDPENRSQYNWATGSNGGGVSTGNAVVDTVVNTISNLSMDTQAKREDVTYKNMVYAVPDMLPLLAGLMNLVSVPFFKSRATEKAIISWISHFGKEPRKTIKKREDKRLPYANIFMLSYGVVIMFAGWFIFLAYTNAYGQDTAQDWKMIIFIYYVIITFISIYLIQKYHNYTPATTTNTILGTIYGVVGLYAMTRLFFQREVVNSFSTVEMHSNGWYAVNTFVFVAPAETLAFCILIPCLIIAWIQIHEGKEPRTEEQLSLRHRISRCDDLIVVKRVQIEQQKNLIDQNKINIETMKYLDGKILSKNKKPLHTTERVAELTDKASNLNDKLSEYEGDLVKLKKLRSRLIGEEKALRPELPLRELLENPRYLGIFIIGIIGASFLFSSSHYPILSAEITYDMFWFCGLGIIYFSGGFWFIIIGIKYGWLSAINCHAIYNTMTILVVILATV